jgi:hypothetical protein
MANLDEETLRAKFEEAQQVVIISLFFLRQIIFINMLYFFRLLYPKVHMKIFLIWSLNMLVNKQRKDKRLQIREQQREMQVLVEVQEPRSIKNLSFNYI